MVGWRQSGTIALVGLLAGAARASEPPPTAYRPCLVAYAIDGLKPAEQSALVATCERPAAPGPELAPLLARIAARADWASTSLAELVGGASFVDLGSDPDRAARLAAVRDALAGLRGQLPACKAVPPALDSYFKARDAGDRTTPPFGDASLAQCTGFAADALAGLALLTIAADDPAAELFVAASAGKWTVLQRLAPADAFIHAGRRVFVVAVPRWSVVSVRLSTAPAPQRWHGFVPNHQTVWNDPPTTGCLRMSVNLDDDTTLLLDGEPLTLGMPLVHRTVSVRAGAHSLVALQCKRHSADSHGECSERYREVLPPVDVSARDNLCRDVALDLHQRHSVAILQARAAPGCDAALAWRAGELAREHLQLKEKALGRSFRDLASYASLAEALGQLRDDLNPIEGQALGAGTGGDAFAQIASVAKEAWRQGIDELVSLELGCSRDGLDLKATAISARELFERQLGPVAGADLKGLLRVQSLAFADDRELPSTVASVLDQLLHRSSSGDSPHYVRFREGSTRYTYRELVHLEILSGSSSGIGSTVRWIDDDSSCDSYRLRPATKELGRFARAHHDSLLMHERSRSSGQTFDLRADVVWRHDLSFRARRPGTYRVAAWDDHGATSARRCISFDVPRRELWAGLMFAPDIGLRTPIPETDARHARVMLGRTWYLRRRPWLGLGVAGGYTFTHHKSRDGVPAWQDLGTVGARDGAVTWARHALVVGPQIEFRSRRADIPVEFRGRLSAVGGFALVDVRKLADFPEFSGATQFGTNNVRLRPTIDLTAELGVGGVFGPLAVTPLLTLGAAAINDMFSGRWATSALSGANLYLGVGLHLGGAR